jgi:hypothetical protein
MAAFAMPQCAQAADATVSGVVRDSSGVPQMDVLVQLMRADSTIIQSVRTDAHGTYLIAGVMPGVYQLKAMETSFLPTLRENLRVNGRDLSDANLTLSTLMEALNWLPAHKRSGTEPSDDWTWTLRSAAYRPLLRYVDADGLETIETPESETGTARNANRGRLLIESGARTFADGGVQQTMELQRQAGHDGQTILRGSVGDAAGAPMTLMAGYSQQNALGSGLTTVVSYQSDHGIGSGNASGLQTYTVRTVDTLRLLPEVVIEAGNQMQMVEVGGATRLAAEPYGNVAWSLGETTASYTITTTPAVASSAGISDDVSYDSLAGEQNGLLRVEHGLHQELKLEHDSASLNASVALYADSIDDPMIDAMGRLTATDLASGAYLVDSGNDLARTVGQNYSSRGVVAELRHSGTVPGIGSVYEAVEFANGSALKVASASTLSAVNADAPSFRPESETALSLTVGGKLPLSGTTWRAAYRMQPSDSVTAVDLFDARVDSGMADAYLSLFLRQPLHHSRIFPGGVDAIVNVRNLLAQGYHPFLTADGSTLFFAQVDRSIQGGLAFYF